jgi:hypothetical protein
MRSIRVLIALALIAVPTASHAVQIIQVHKHSMELRSMPGVQVLHLVPGSPAPADGLPASVDRWYVGCGDTGVESIAALLGARATTGRDAAVAQPMQLAIHPVTNPTASSLDVMCDLPGSEPASIEVFDVMGRRVTGREITMATAGTARVRLDSGVKLAPGSYWLKLTQGSRTPVSLRIVVAR